MLRRAGAGADVRAANVTVAESLLVASLAGMGNVLLTNPIWMVSLDAGRERALCKEGLRTAKTFCTGWRTVGDMLKPNCRLPSMPKKPSRFCLACLQVATRMQALSRAKAGAAARAAAAAKAAKAGGGEGAELEVEPPTQLGMVAGGQGRGRWCGQRCASSPARLGGKTPQESLREALISGSAAMPVGNALHPKPTPGLCLPMPHPPSPCPPNRAVARQVYSEYGLAGFWNGTAASLIMVINPTLQVAQARSWAGAGAGLHAVSQHCMKGAMALHDIGRVPKAEHSITWLSCPAAYALCVCGALV